MKKQTFFPKARDLQAPNTCAIGALGRDRPVESCYRRGKDWHRHQVCRHDTFLLNVFESYSSAEYIGYTRQEDYLKINFWLGGKHTTVLDGFGEHEHDRPEAFITAGPAEMIKVDLHGKDARVASVALCLRRDFFPMHMGIQVEDLPEPLRAIVTPDAFSYAFHRFPLTADLLAATRAILAAPFAVRREAVYSQAKAVELMCLLINRLTADDRKMEPRSHSHNRHESRLRDARELLTRHYAQGLTLERISKEVGLNRMALTSGFRELFGMSVYDCLLKERMEHAYELLQDKTNTVGQVAEAVGYGHSCNFSTAFHDYFGCTPQQVRATTR